MEFSYRERFFGYTHGFQSFAPLTLGAPAYTMIVDYKIFEKTAKEKLELALIKAQHRKALIKAYGNGTKKLNVLAE